MRYEFVEPLRRLRLVLDDNPSGLSFNLMWEGSSAAIKEAHHLAVNRGRRTTDQTRYTQAGTASGSITSGKTTYSVSSRGWSGARDHSWGLYAERPPLGPEARWLPPPQPLGPRRALRIWTLFRTGPLSGFYHLHETADGEQTEMSDVFGTPFGGAISRGWGSEPIELVAGSHRLEFHSGSRF